jgi:hypothetical protein
VLHRKEDESSDPDDIKKIQDAGGCVTNLMATPKSTSFRKSLQKNFKNAAHPIYQVI